MKNSEKIIPNEEQNKALLSEAKNVLVLGGGGFGKTSLLAMKAEKLIKEKSCLPAEILVLTDTEFAADKLKTLASKFDIQISTLYKYALDIICKCEGKVPKINKKSLSDFAFEEIKKLCKKSEYYSLISEFASNGGAQNDYDYEKYLAQNPPTTYAGERVKSRGEVEIADFLYMAKIKYEYEAAYEKDTRTEKYGQYYPDFYLPDYKIYIEYFGVDREGKVPSYFRGDNPSEEYNAQIKWKKELHAANGTKLIDLYAYQHFEGALLPELESRLLALGVKIKSKKRTDFKKNMLLSFAAEKLMSDFNSKPENIAPQLRKIAEDISEKYRDYTEKNGVIEIENVLPHAEKYILNGEYPTRYILADEFDDFSKEKRDFIFSLAEIRKANLFCVAENFDFTENAKKYPFSEIIELKKSYRLPSEVLFLLKSEMLGGECQKYDYDKTSDYLDFIESYTYEGLAEKLAHQLDMLPQGSTALICAREESFFGEKSNKFELKYDAKNNALKLKYVLRPDLKMIFSDMKKAKRYCADYVFVFCTGKKDTAGFLYTAVCRAKKKAWLMGISGSMPEYVEKTKKHLGRTDENKIGICPRCGGKLIIIKGKYGDFIGCSNYNLKKCTYRIALKH